ncbi:MAG: hypothetical protein Q8Q56_00915, partial [Alphaproteobacteria bacterium]|nr:hypothetical protein [Alphaproteobacteria bacterium]
HGSRDINVDERRDHHAALQVYVNVIKLFCQPILNIHEAITARDTMSAAEWRQTYEAMFNEAAEAFNAMTAAGWDERIKAQQEAFKKYSRD